MTTQVISAHCNPTIGIDAIRLECEKSASEKPPGWPDALAPEAFHGLAGEVVDVIEPHTEADTAALLTQFLAAAGNVIGRDCHWLAEADVHSLKLFVVLVGLTAKGRKGTSWGHIRRLMHNADPTWLDRNISGLGSGEGLIHAVRDPSEKDEKDQGQDDKRLFVVETEFASVLRVAARDGSTLSAILRLAWDTDHLQIATKNCPLNATGAHISLVGHITRDELIRDLTATDTANGFANRILWVCAQRSKLLPEGGQVPIASLQKLERRLKDVLEFARCGGRQEFRRDTDARRIWNAMYSDLSEGKPGLFGSIISRGEAQVMRLASIYAVLDHSQEIRAEHLKAGLAVWRYCENSARFIFGDQLGDPVADQLLSALRAYPDGLTKAQLHNALGRNRSASVIDAALNTLSRYKFAKKKTKQTRGRRAEVWMAVKARS
jgi:Protein of unknown function (DUF3987)